MELTHIFLKNIHFWFAQGFLHGFALGLVGGLIQNLRSYEV